MGLTSLGSSFELDNSVVQVWFVHRTNLTGRISQHVKQSALVLRRCSSRQSKEGGIWEELR